MLQGAGLKKTLGAFYKAPDDDLSADLLLMIGSSPVCAQVCGSDKDKGSKF